ncbi:hypothetical protein IFM89_004150 [Coptis chinensis]|uniref:F-box associated domain-containing protein n=1 Tax=Coptis chinensis TaxID=261450 RepID=A0A835H482_9MAGN|nr:hypothetical protein IFM89_004150 [Coptis chinensis]
MNPSYVFFNGSFHWVAKSAVNHKKYVVIVSLNVATEEFSIILLPSIIKGHESARDYELMVLSGRLCVPVLDSRGYYRETWVKKEYGKLGSWAKEYVFTEVFGVSKQWPFSLCTSYKRMKLVYSTALASTCLYYQTSVCSHPDV